MKVLIKRNPTVHLSKLVSKTLPIAIKYLSYILILVFFSACAGRGLPYGESVEQLSSSKAKAPESLYDIESKSINQEGFKLSELEGQVVLFSNIALNCGTTVQLADLQKVYEQFSDQGFLVVGIPSQGISPYEPSDTKVIRSHCTNTHSLSFPILSPMDLKEDVSDPLLNFLTTSGPEESRGPIEFHLEKFLISRDGKLIKRFGPFTPPLSSKIIREIEAALK